MDRRRDDQQRQRVGQQNLEQFIQSLELPIEEATTPEEVATTRQRAQRVERPDRATPPAVARKPSLRGELMRMLSSRRMLRHAIILNEIIGPPKALKKPGDR